MIANQPFSGCRCAADCPLTRFDHSESRRFSIRVKEGERGRGRERERERERDNCSRKLMERGGRSALGNGYAPHRRRRWHDRGREGKREAKELLKEATRNPQTSLLTGRPVFSYGRHMVCTRWPKHLRRRHGCGMRDKKYMNEYPVFP
jgi:hypothetical protein